ncbi:hypothetical protein WICANDRAFT_78659 [Wickerhamomyces anomalus NRRL Y-366-8]|uniref:Cell wall protein n=1 Tax=Wickerhamomyces anomalus (strain ATCC 58044 / CBS 1984 / NCYC 433 / NRRL Y-366-8) TaxID=683960 RepID=A0A1E3P5D3_WICAA|nr:uncharacterized protein WICANDRAFT_78659 [Wickerhamomyces anomalus NRRL Y-366-8]ODQ60037.1 hypothetical protein WICANDRAFT_78659 [Wickerhamomyces anomalus NRRL Y-366-8]
MKLSFLLSFLSTSAIVLANTQNFTLKCFAPNTVLEDANLHVDEDNKIYIANVSETATGQLLNNGSLAIGDTIMGIGKNYLSLEADSTSFEYVNSWSIENGYLKLYGSDFHAVPSGMDGIYVLGSINAAAGRDDVIPIAIKAEDSSGATIADFNPESGSSSSVLSVLGSQTFDHSSASMTALKSSVSSSNLGSENFVKLFGALGSGLVALIMMI